MNDREIEEEKDAELRALATVWGKNHGLNYSCLPVKGIVSLRNVLLGKNGARAMTLEEQVTR